MKTVIFWFSFIVLFLIPKESYILLQIWALDKSKTKKKENKYTTNNNDQKTPIKTKIFTENKR